MNGRGRPGREPEDALARAISWPGAPRARMSCVTSPTHPGAGTDGDIDALSLWAGQGVGLVHRIQPAAEIVREIAAEAQATLSRLGSTAAFLGQSQ
jgi:NAD(P)H-dependent flavin oxidoreductase YrpB (nitropropane dioxygenase family)